MLQTVKYYVKIIGKEINANEEFIKAVQRNKQRLKRVQTEQDCDVILALCPISSRIGTDIESAERKLNVISGKPAVLVLLHSTFDPELVVPDSSTVVKRNNTIAVDCLFSEDQGLMKCDKNDAAVAKVIAALKSQKNRSSLSWTGENNRQSEKTSLIREEDRRPCCPFFPCFPCCCCCCCDVCPS